MFCLNCGEKFIEPNQKFCQNCGHSVKTITNTTQSSSQITIRNTQSLSQITRQSAGNQQKSIRAGSYGPHSKRCLIFGIVSLGFNLVAGIIFVSPLRSYYYNYYFYYGFVSFITTFIIRVITLVAGLVFGILARSNSTKAKEIDLINPMQKSGKIMGLIGIIFASLGIADMLFLDILDLDFFIFNASILF